MNRIEQLFLEKRREGKTALILYLTAGYPDLETTEALIPELEKAGADLIEIGVPFSDPIADGPTIQKASSVSLNSGTTLKKILSLIRRLRKKTQMPFLLFSAYNPFYKYGLENLVRDCVRISVDGLLVPDMPPDEAEDFISLCNAENLSLVFLVAPTTPPERAQRIVNLSTGFIYYVSTMGVTGARKKLDKTVDSHIALLRKMTDKPLAVGFGISRPEHAARLKDKVDGVIIGSALIREIGAGRNLSDRIMRAVRFTRQIAKVL